LAETNSQWAMPSPRVSSTLQAEPESTFTATLVTDEVISSTASVVGGTPGLPGVVPAVGVVAALPVMSTRTGTAQAL
jgi:hypothetical protein